MTSTEPKAPSSRRGIEWRFPPEMLIDGENLIDVFDLLNRRIRKCELQSTPQSSTEEMRRAIDEYIMTSAIQSTNLQLIETVKNLETQLDAMRRDMLTLELSNNSGNSGTQNSGNATENTGIAKSLESFHSTNVALRNKVEEVYGAHIDLSVKHERLSLIVNTKSDEHLMACGKLADRVDDCVSRQTLEERLRDLEREMEQQIVTSRRKWLDESDELHEQLTKALAKQDDGPSSVDLEARFDAFTQELEAKVAQVCVYVYSCIFMLTYLYIHVFTYLCIYIFMHIHIFMYIHIFIFTFILTHIFTYILTHIFIFTYIHIFKYS